MLTRAEVPTELHSHRRARRSRLGSVVWRMAAGAVVVLLVVGVAAAATQFLPLGSLGSLGSLGGLGPLGRLLPPWTPAAGAGVVTTLLCGLAVHRVGGHPAVATLFAGSATAVAVLTGWPWLLAGVAALTAVAATVLAVVVTRPAKRPVRLVGEYALAVSVALAGAVAVAGYGAPLRPIMLGHVVLLTSLTATLWLAHRLGGGFPGLGKRGAVVILSAVTVLVVGLAYGEALRRWGSPGLIESVAAVRRAVVDVLGAVPRPLEVFIGFPALVWGLATRANLRQGWWVCAFGSLGTAGIASSLAGPGTRLPQELLSTVYSVLVGLALGFLVWGLDRLLTGPRGRRARRADRAVPLRPEPSRSRPLL